MSGLTAMTDPGDESPSYDDYCEDCYELHKDCRCPCPQCGDGEWWDNEESACIDDLCHGGPVPCMHGDYARIPCGLCGK